MMFLGLRKLGTICCGHKIRVRRNTNLCCSRWGKRGNICVGNNVSSFTRTFRFSYFCIRSRDFTRTWTSTMHKAFFFLRLTRGLIFCGEKSLFSELFCGCRLSTYAAFSFFFFNFTIYNALVYNIQLEFLNISKLHAYSCCLQ